MDNKSQVPKNNFQTNNKSRLTNFKIYNLSDRTLEFSKRIIRLCKKLPNNTVNFKLVDQLIRSSGSIGANYLEANDSLGKRDFIHRLKIARKETKETIYWLELVRESENSVSGEILELTQEATELRNILSSIINKIDV